MDNPRKGAQNGNINCIQYVHEVQVYVCVRCKATHLYTYTYVHTYMYMYMYMPAPRAQWAFRNAQISGSCRGVQGKGHAKTCFYEAQGILPYTHNASPHH